MEITVDDESLIPPMYTSEDGKFIIELEPGSVGSMLKPVYESILAQFHRAPLITRPIAGQYFSSKKTSNISGVVAGGDCEFSIASEAGDTEVKAAVNGCYEETVIVDENNNYYFHDVLLIYNISVYHQTLKLHLTQIQYL